VARDVLVHLEHGDLLLAVEDRLQHFVSVDLGPLFLVLKIVLLDVDPQLGNDLGAGKRLGADNRGQFIIRLDGLEEGGVGFAFGGFGFGCHGFLLALHNLLAIFFLL
jgi:hypothetical protein